MTPRFRVADRIVAISVPLVPVISCWSFANLVLRICARASDRDELPFSYTCAALRSRNFNLALADKDFSMVVSSYKNSKARFAPLGANGDVGRIDFRVRIAALVHGVVRHTVSQLNLDLRARQLRDVGLRVFRQPERVGIVKFKFSACFVAGRNPISGKHGSIQRRRRPILGIAALRRHIAMNQADACHAIFFSRGRSVVTRFGTCVSGIRVVEARIVRTCGRGLIHRTLTGCALAHCRILVGIILAHCALIVTNTVGTGHRCLDIGRRLRIRIGSLIVLILGEHGAWNRHRQSQKYCC